MSDSQRFTFVGIEPLATSNGFSFVSLDDTLSLLAIGEGSLKDIFSFLVGQKMVRVAIHAPAYLGTSHSTDSEIQTDEAIPAREYRTCEFQLWQKNIPCDFTAVKPGRISAPLRLGYQLIQTLQQYEFSFSDPSAKQRSLIETCPAACYHQLLNTAIQQEPLLWRFQHQLILHKLQLPVQDPMIFFEEITRHKLLMGKVSLENILIPEELNAMVSAYTAWLSHHHPEKVTSWGDESDGFLVLPIQNQTI
jgi:hypothetical protein